LVLKALKKENRYDLIGNGPKALVKGGNFQWNPNVYD
jgi:hypothetical protein